MSLKPKRNKKKGTEKVKDKKKCAIALIALSIVKLARVIYNSLRNTNTKAGIVTAN